jgi:murein DD-endopeptidase MepM/ murein hydrolase activator NlpD
MVDFEGIWPWPKGTRSTQEFGTNPGGVNPGGGHTGLDAGLPIGTPLRAPADGVITFEGWAVLGNNPYLLTDGGGICLAEDFGNNLPATIMGHLSTTFVSKGDRVKRGQIICESGNTGRWTTGPHVHLEALPPFYDMNKGNTYGRVNPRLYFTKYWEDLNVPTLLQPHQRETMTKVWERTAPDHTSDLTRVKLWDEELIFDFDAYILGSDPHGDGNRVWFKSLHRGTYYHSSGFKDMDTHNLPNITPPPFVPPVQPAPEPAPEPAPTGVLHGIDVSNHQGDINLALMPGDFMAIKVSEGVGWADAKAERNARNVPEGVQRILYHYARPDKGNKAEDELAWFIECALKIARPGDILCLDWEHGTPEELGHVEWVDIFCTGLQFRFGGIPLPYMGRKGIDAAGERWAPVEAKFPHLWYPAYGKDQTIEGYHPEQNGARPPVVWGGKPMLIWQYSQRGRLPGYTGDLDLNVAYCSREELAALGITRLAAEPDPTPVPVPVPDPKPAPEPKAPPTKDQPISALVDYYKEQQ